jgi:acyl-CoA synthetase (AMP-forming)/AMP-acid ligase II
MYRLQLADPDPARCMDLWRRARDLPAVICLGDTLPYVAEVVRSPVERDYFEPVQPAPIDAELIHYTSGTTGGRRPIGRTWASLDAGIHASDRLKNQYFACGYPVDTMAGIQVVLTCEASGARPISTLSASAMADAMTYCKTGSATGAMWRAAIALGASGAHVQQITSGGDGLDGRTLENMRRAFPNARITQIYASTEAGVICSWSDGLPGIPGEAFDRTCYILAGEVVVHESPLTCGRRCYTGDVAERRDGRVYITGRLSSLINVGGVKVPAEVVERTVLEQCAGISSVKAYAVRDSVLGQHVAVDVIGDADELKQVKWSEKYHRPLTVRQVSEIRADLAGKVLR